MSPEILALTYGISSAVSWGAGDFSGGVATKKGEVVTVIFFSQIIGVFLLFSLYLFFPEAFPTPRQLLWGAVAGLMGAFGLVVLYKGLAGGHMGIVAPLSAVMTALVPALFALYLEGVPRFTQIIGLGCGLVAIWFLSTGHAIKGVDLRQLVLPLMAGVGFGLFFVCMDQASQHTVIWPLIWARLASLLLFGVVLLQRRSCGLPPKHLWGWIALSGMLDTAGNAFFVLAVQLGRLDVSAVLASLYPGATVFLAWRILGERLKARQWLGVGIALLSTALMAA